MRPRNARGDGTVAEAGRYATHGERKRASPVAVAISSIDPGSAVSGATLVGGTGGASAAKIRKRAAPRDRIIREGRSARLPVQDHPPGVARHHDLEPL